MSRTGQSWPVKTRELQNWMLDSTRWNGLEMRAGDVVICTWSKAGTTWMQQIVGQLLFPHVPDLPVLDVAPWVDGRFVPRAYVEALLRRQTHRRFMKSHLPLDALVFSPRAKYIYVGRDGRDVLWSWYNHHASFSPTVYEAINGMPELAGAPLEPPTGDVRSYFHDWLDRDGHPVQPFWPHVQSWWDARGLDNVLLVHFNRLKADLSAEMRRIARFLGTEIDAASWPDVVERCTFEHMKRHAGRLARALAAGFAGGADAFVYKGTNGRWRDVLTPEDVAKYEHIAASRLTPDCAHWLSTGEEPACA